MYTFTLITSTLLVLTYQADSRLEAVMQARNDGYQIYAVK